MSGEALFTVCPTCQILLPPLYFLENRLQLQAVTEMTQLMNRRKSKWYIASHCHLS